ncbi:MAG: hypothetical protein NT145_07210 [Elusimicrobia bacterium]|nr:hypothetical protein [Elusimicrobiota bacterium]
MFWLNGIVIYSFIIFSVFLSGCNPTYPVGNLTESIQKLVKKEYNLESKASLVGNTLYLDIKLEDISSTETKKLSAMLEKLQGAVLSIVRVSLSTDAKISFMVVTAIDPVWKLGIRIIESLQDIKDYLYQKISRGEYEGRLVMEIDIGQDGLINYTSDKEMTLNEFAGRLTVSQFNMLLRSNPFLSILLNKYELKYVSFVGSELVLTGTKNFDPQMFELARHILVNEAEKTSKKYELIKINTIKILDPNKPDAQPILIDITKEIKSNKKVNFKF